MRKLIPMEEDHYDLVQCQICKKWYKSLNAHIQTHGITIEEYISKYPGYEITSKKVRDSKSGKNHPMYKGKVEKTCMYCDKTYHVVQSLSGISKYCSKECKDKSNIIPKIKRICECCENVFYVIPSREDRKFCSMKCKITYQVGEKHPDYLRKELVCAQCGQVYEVVPSAVAMSKFCSQDCKAEYQKTSMLGVSQPHKKGYKHTDETKRKLSIARMGENNPAWKPKLLKVCAYCGDEFEVIPSMKRLRFCSMQCSANANRGENNPNWQGGISFGEYCPKFNEETRKYIRDKYNNCDYMSELPDYICNSDRSLDVHHVDYNKEQGCDDHEWRLIPLSRSNHARTNYNRPFWNRLFTYALQYDEEYYKHDNR